MVNYVNRKEMKIRESGRSTDFISPSFGYGCLYNCLYCYMKRHKSEGLSIAKNYNDILTAINNHATWLEYPKKPNQTHEKYYTYDISCNEDFALHLKYHQWEKIFDFFKNDERILGSFATKYVNKELLNYNPEGKIRIRFSLMPQSYSTVLEPNTSKIINRIRAVNDFIEAGYDVHLNFSPVILDTNCVKEYTYLFEGVDALIDIKYKHKVKAEVIFLTHNENKHYENLKTNIFAESILWKPELQENKISQYGGKNIRYRWQLKKDAIRDFIDLHDDIIKWNTIRYIF